MSSSQDRARALAISQDFGGEALKLNEQLVASDGSDLPSRTRLARCYRDAGRLDDSEAQYREVLRLDPRNRIAAGGLLSIDAARGNGEAAADVAARGLRASRAAKVRRAPKPPRAEIAPSSDAAPVPLVFTGFEPRAFAELGSCPPRDVRARFAPRVNDLVKRINALPSSKEIAAIRQADHRQLFRASRADVHVEAARWSVVNIGGRFEPQISIGMYAGTGQIGDWLRIGVGFDLANDGADAEHPDGVREVRNHFRRLQAILASPRRSLLVGWMIKEGGLIEFDEAGPRLDVHQPSEAADLVAGCDADRTRWVFFGKWLSPGRPDDAATLSDPVALVRLVDRTFTGLMPLWRALWE
jgi:tetratricopeptide (TPR) repeat protein